ncbi:M23 family metallopeptidase [Marisediminicola sp. LYQ134]|uniref:M23 family metallopeptidase n=1 Tax=Marisediminicola sp. LYQ134 TaxID=3391061 RepID=UPI003983D829
MSLPSRLAEVSRLSLAATALVCLAIVGASPPPSVRGGAGEAVSLTVPGSDPSNRGEPGRWAWPAPSPHVIVREFVAPATAYSAGHRGIDVGAAEGAEVTAPEAGTVHFAGVVVDRPVVSIRHADGLVSSFEPVDPSVSEGDIVARGQQIGTLEAGHCAAPCLHLGARLDGAYVSPLLYLTGIPRAVLLPTRPLE